MVPASYRLNSLARELNMQMNATSDTAGDLPAQIVGERMAAGFIAALADTNAVPDELMCAIGLLGKDEAGGLRWFLRAVQAHLRG